jgi:hypothetical protein
MTLPHQFNNVLGLKVTGGTGGVSGTSLPAGSSGTVDNVRDSTENSSVSIDTQSTAFSQSAGATTDTGVILVIRRTGTSQISIYGQDTGGANGDFTTHYCRLYNNAGSFSTLSSASLQLLWQLDGYTPTHFKVARINDSTINSGGSASFTTYNSYTLDTWLAVPNVNDEIKVEPNNGAGAAPVALNSSRFDNTISFWVRASGYNDTEVLKLNVDQYSEAEAEP